MAYFNFSIKSILATRGSPCVTRSEFTILLMLDFLVNYIFVYMCEYVNVAIAHGKVSLESVPRNVITGLKGILYLQFYFY